MEEIEKLRKEFVELREKYIFILQWIYYECYTSVLPERIVNEIQVHIRDNIITAASESDEIQGPVVYNRDNLLNTSGENFTCKKCNKKFKSGQLLKVHQRKHFSPYIFQKKIKNNKKVRYRQAFRCLTCGIILTIRRKYLKHVRNQRTVSAIKSRDTKNKLTEPHQRESHRKLSVRLENLHSGSIQSVAELLCKNGINNVHFVLTSLFSALKGNAVSKKREDMHFVSELSKTSLDITVSESQTGEEMSCYAAKTDDLNSLQEPTNVHLKQEDLEIKQEPDDSMDNFLGEMFNENDLFIDMKATNTSDTGDLINETRNSHSRNVIRNSVVFDRKPMYFSNENFEDNISKNEVKKPSRVKRKEFPCAKCGTNFKNKIDLKFHKNEHYVFKYPNSRWENDFGVCGLCEKTFKKKYLLRKHEFEHENPGIERALWKCTECSSVFKNKITLNNHMRKHVGIHSYVCSHCGKGFFEMRYLKDHERIHSEMRSYKCDFCEKAFKTRQGKFTHEAKHKGTMTAICNLCGFSFSTKNGLDRHIQGVHENKRPFNCHLCEKKFKSKNSLRYHIKTHSNPNSKNRGLNRDIDPLVAALKRRKKVPPNVIIVPVHPSSMENK